MPPDGPTELEPLRPASTRSYQNGHRHAAWPATEIALMNSEVRFRQALRDSSVMTFGQGRDLRYTWVYNPPAPATPELFVGHSDEELFPPAEAAALTALKRRVLDHGDIARGELPISIGGQRLLFEIKVDPVVDEDGQVSGLIGLALNVTERAQDEERRIERARRLQDRQRLESLCALASGIAHDFNNLLAIIRGNADLTLLDKTSNPTIRANMQQVVIAASRAADLTRQLLTYAGHGRSDMRPLGLNDLVREHALLLEASVERSVRLAYRLAPELPRVLADGTQLVKALLNLVVNAAEALGRAGGAVTISTEARLMGAEDLAACPVGGEQAAGPYVALSVEDAGTGIEAALLERIFEPFFSTKLVGRGLGLAVVQGIVLQHHGALQVRSTPERGSRFTLLIPVLQGAAQPQPVWLAAANGRQPGGTVLVVDDEAGVRLLAGRMVEHFGCAALLAADGPTALELMQAHLGEIACVLLDVTMPRMDGIEVFRELRRLAPTTPVLLMSGYRIDDLMHSHPDLGAAGFLQKPFTFESLGRSLERLGVPVRE